MSNFFLGFMTFFVLEATNHKTIAYQGFQASHPDVTHTDLEEADDSELILAGMSSST